MRNFYQSIVKIGPQIEFLTWRLLVIKSVAIHILSVHCRWCKKLYLPLFNLRLSQKLSHIDKKESNHLVSAYFVLWRRWIKQLHWCLLCCYYKHNSNKTHPPARWYAKIYFKWKEHFAIRFCDARLFELHFF